MQQQQQQQQQQQEAQIETRTFSGVNEAMFAELGRSEPQVRISDSKG